MLINRCTVNNFIYGEHGMNGMQRKKESKETKIQKRRGGTGNATIKSGSRNNNS